jgi:hypothetical protein
MSPLRNIEWLGLSNLSEQAHKNVFNEGPYKGQIFKNLNFYSRF